MRFRKPAGLLSVFLAAAWPCAGQCPISFAASIPTGGGPFQWGVVAGDFNEDGRIDIAFARQTSNQVAVQLAAGSPGSFLSPTTYAVGSQPFNLGIGDCNGDGRPDLVTPNGSSNTISLLRGIGGAGGGFEPAVHFGVGASPQNLLVRDLNGDGRADVVTANDGSGNITIRLADAAGGFAVGINHAVGDNPFGLAAADFSGDGLPDLAVGLLDSPTIKLFRNTGGGSFVAAGMTTAGVSTFWMAAADVNLDAKQDLLVGDATEGLYVRLGDGLAGMTFQSATRYSAVPFPAGMAVGDFNADGRPDIAVNSFTMHMTAVLVGNGTGAGTFEAPVLYAVGANPNGISIADFTGDEKPDLMVSSQGGAANTTRLLVNTSPACIADFDCSGGTPTVQDLLDYLTAYFGSSPRADVNASGSVSVQDIFDFLAAYFAGCA